MKYVKKKHSIPNNGIKANHRVQKLIKLELNTFEAGLFFDECRQEIEDIERQVDIRREDLKVKIDKCSDDIIKSVESSQKNFIKLVQINQSEYNENREIKDCTQRICDRI